MQSCYGRSFLREGIHSQVTIKMANGRAGLDRRGERKEFLDWEGALEAARADRLMYFGDHEVLGGLEATLDLRETP